MATGLTAETFNQLLDWLGPDRNAAARRYEEIRSRLIRIFVCRGCAAADELADHTMDRVAGKIQQISGTYVGDPAPYFYGVAEKIYLEHVKPKPAFSPPAPDIPAAEVEVKYVCLEGCTERLSAQNRELIFAYYGDDGRKKIELRKELAARFGVGANALRIRAHRIRESLERCVSECFKQAARG